MNARPNIPIAEQYRLAAKSWCDLDGAARMLEEAKTAVLAQRMKALGDMPAAHSEREVKASEEWADYIKKMVDARTAANLAKVKLEWVRMRFSEWQSEEANKRAEMKLT
jgi:hypothetical protein